MRYLRHKHMSQLEFTRSIGVSPAYVAAMRKGISAKTAKLIKEKYPDLNTDWLLFGEGEMLIKVSECDVSLHDGFETLMLPVSAFAGNLQLWSEGVGIQDCQRIAVPVKGADFAIPVKGDSMEPMFHDGSTLLIKRIDEKAFIPWGHPMVIDTVNGVLVKNLFPYDGSDDFVEARSMNPKYPPIKIPTDSIYGIYRVIGSFEIFL